MSDREINLISAATKSWIMIQRNEQKYQSSLVFDNNHIIRKNGNDASANMPEYEWGTSNVKERFTFSCLRFGARRRRTSKNLLLRPTRLL